MTWHRDKRTGMYWQTLDTPRLTDEQRRQLFDPSAQLRWAVAYIRQRYGCSWREQVDYEPVGRRLGRTSRYD
jgi:hypothetical protein